MLPSIGSPIKSQNNDESIQSAISWKKGDNVGFEVSGRTNMHKYGPPSIAIVQQSHIHNHSIYE